MTLPEAPAGIGASSGRFRRAGGRLFLVPFLIFVLNLLLASFMVGCTPEKLHLEKSYFCDDFNGSKCTLPQSEDRTYRFDVPASKLESWFDLDYYMYFHSRETPGIRLEWNRPLKRGELESLRKNLHCSYRFGREKTFVEGELEGRRIDEDGRGLWCFDYLGTMMVRLHKKMEIIKGKPSPDFFPVEMTLIVSGPLPAVQASRSARIRLQWRPKEGME